MILLNHLGATLGSGCLRGIIIPRGLPETVCMELTFPPNLKRGELEVAIAFELGVIER